MTDLLDVMLVQRWMDGQIARARDSGLSQAMLGSEMMTRGFALLVPGLDLHVARNMVVGMLGAMAAGATAQIKASGQQRSDPITDQVANNNVVQIAERITDQIKSSAEP